MKISWPSIFWGVSVSILVSYIPFIGWVIAPIVGGLVAGYLSPRVIKQGAISGIIVGFTRACLWFIISVIHWKDWMAVVYKIGWISEPFMQSSQFIFVIIFYIIYVGFGFFGGIAGSFLKNIKRVKTFFFSHFKINGS